MIVLAVVVGLVVWYRRKSAAASSTSQPSAAFENPMYDMNAARAQSGAADDDSDGYMDVPAGASEGGYAEARESTGGYMDVDALHSNHDEDSDRGYIDMPQHQLVSQLDVDDYDDEEDV